MRNNDANWTTVAGKPKGKAAPSSTKPSGIPVMPKAEIKTIKLSDSAFSSMKSRLPEENDENQPGEIKPQKPVVAAASIEKSPPMKTNKPNKSSSNALSLKQALQNISADKIKELYQSSKDNSSLWVEKVCYWFIEQFKDVTSGFNDPTFSKEDNQDYPLNALPTSVKENLKEIFDTQAKLKGITLCRTAILNPNADVHGIVGYQVLLQYFLRNLHERPNDSFLDDVDDLSTSIKRYPSDKVLRLLWAYSQVQYQYPGLALDIWFRLMFPLIENRTYNQLIVENLSQITTRHAKHKKFLQANETFPLESHIKLIDFVDQPNPALTRDMRTSLSKSATILADLFLNNTKNLAQYSRYYFQVLFPVLHADKQRPSKSQSYIDRMIVACLTDKSIHKIWLSCHQKDPQSSLDLLSLLHTNETTISGLSSSKELRTIVQQLRTISTEIVDNEENDNVEHREFLSAYSKNDAVVVNKCKANSQFKISSVLKLLVLLYVSFTIYQNWLWLTVAADYLLEDYMKHPTAVVIKERLSNACIETRKLALLSLKHGEEFLRSTMANIEPYAIQYGQYIQKQWNHLLKHIEGPIYDKSAEIAEQIQKLSIIIFNQSVHYLKLLFDWSSYYTANLTYLAEIYITQAYEIVHDKVANFDAKELREKFDQFRMRVIKSV
ncbi:unnamed protein product [Rotaria socialis]|uniref:Uncharacterized protein n=1 Tax=Rotaria socialis TaxID=392032 RepID=A0A817VN84_9BILA|nr:unnamed protein product [Rotaria socialis]CAF3351475.1 unnamed protein product [Rotaria socialis]